MILQVILGYQLSQPLVLALAGIALLMAVWIVMYLKSVVAAPSSLPILVWSKPESSGIWYVFSYSAILLILNVRVPFTNDNIAVATLSAIQSMILAMLLVSSCIAAIKIGRAHV